MTEGEIRSETGEDGFFINVATVVACVRSRGTLHRDLVRSAEVSRGHPEVPTHPLWRDRSIIPVTIKQADRLEMGSPLHSFV